MDLILLCVVIIALVGARIGFAGEYLNSYLKREHAVAVNGIFVMSPYSSICS